MSMEKSVKTNVDQLDEPEIINEILAGKKELFEVLIRKYNRRFFRIASSYLKELKEQEDVIQNAYLKAFVNLSKFEQRSKFSTWITRILINECLQEIKRSKKHIGESELEIPGREETFTPDRIMINKEFRSVLEELIFTLPEKLRIVYMMREVEGMDTEETAKCLSLTEVNVKVRLNRAKDHLKKALSKIYNPGELFFFDGEKCDRIVEKVFKSI